MRGERLKDFEKKITATKNKSREQVIYKFPYRCPYCDQPVSYDQFNLKLGENKVQCPSCKKIYIKVVSGRREEGKAE